jgi:hypothetical protein
MVRVMLIAVLIQSHVLMLADVVAREPPEGIGDWYVWKSGSQCFVSYSTLGICYSLEFWAIAHH